MLEVILSSPVAAAVKQTGRSFHKVFIETETPSSTGLFHIKIRHLDNFIEYYLRRRGNQEQEFWNSYYSLHQLGSDQRVILEKYGKLILDFNETYEHIEAQYPGGKGRVMDFIGEAKSHKRAEKFHRLMAVYNEESYKNHCHIVRKIGDDIVQVENRNQNIFRILNDDISDCLKVIIQNPAAVYWNKLKKDFTFCSEEYDSCFVISLKIDEVQPDTAYLFTGFKASHDVLRRSPTMKRIYVRG